jgi:hypothetical protein
MMCAGTAGLAAAIPRGRAEDSSKVTSSVYSESVMAVLYAPDASQEISIRLGRMVGQGAVTLWAGYASSSAAFSMADIRPATNLTRTSVDADIAAYSEAPSWTAKFDRSGRIGEKMVGRAEMTGGLNATADPPEGEGQISGRIEMTFESLHRPMLVRPGRMEVFGLGSGRVVLPDGGFKISGYAKWHEQVGDRARFAPAFTYMAISASNVALLAVTSGNAAYGFALEGGKTTPVATAKFAEPGPQRHFEASLVDGRTIHGMTNTVRTSSEPIEGKRRPSATVIAETDLGRMVGQVNDWRPEG